MEALPRTRVLAIPLHTISMQETLNIIQDKLSVDHPSHICFVNAHCANLAYRDPEYLRVLQAATLVLPDGVGLHVAGKILGRAIPHNVNGTDLFPPLCTMLAECDASVFLLGGQPGVAEGVRKWLTAHSPHLRLAGVRHGYFSAEEEPQVIGEIAASSARFLFVAFGAPLQDVWISRHLSALGVRVAMGVGGLFDFYSGRLPRAPLWLRRQGGEWLYRLYQEPRRMWRRYILGNPLFLLRVFRERLRSVSQNSDTKRWSVNAAAKRFPL